MTSHPLLQHSEFCPAEDYHPFWLGTWGKPRKKVFARLKHQKERYEYLKILPPKNSNPEFYSYTSRAKGVMVLSEYQALCNDLTNELMGMDTGLPTLMRSDPSPWDHWNELQEKPWRDGFFRNEDGSEVVLSPLDFRKGASCVDLTCQPGDDDDATDDATDDDATDDGTMDDAENDAAEDGATFRVFQIIGQPGIGMFITSDKFSISRYDSHRDTGKSMSLYVILAQRLMESKPTFLQNTHGEAVFFCSSGAYRVQLTERPVWATKLKEEMLLLDSNVEVQSPANFWRRTPVPIVEAASPRSERIEWAEKMASKQWYMRPMSLKEFLAASTLQSQKVDESALKFFYATYGPNARNAYHRCRGQTGLDSHHLFIQDKIRGFTSEQLRSVFKEATDTKNDSVSHHIMLITAGPTRTRYRSGFITRHIFQLARERYENDKDCRIIDLFSLFNSQETTRASAGYIFEDTIHRILKKGICLQARKMRDTTGPKNNIYKTNLDHPVQWLVVGSTVQLSLRSAPPSGPLPFSVFEGHDNELQRGVYCQPKSPNNATFDAYFWNEAQRIIWMLQFTVSDEHDVKQSGVQWIKDRAPDDVQIRFVIFSSQEHARLVIPKTAPKMDYIYHVYVSDLEALAKVIMLPAVTDLS
ncbi:hypothetical protein VKT23_002383 [Stygiomarasmius scandens]|uniref:Uncharacterized protein n=1 Tax=Marasmiellus scandens TaxID=2682957 RepID=A0ABR1K275_9AGAR